MKAKFNGIGSNFPTPTPELLQEVYDMMIYYFNESEYLQTNVDSLKATVDIFRKKQEDVEEMHSSLHKLDPSNPLAHKIKDIQTSLRGLEQDLKDYDTLFADAKFKRSSLRDDSKPASDSPTDVYSYYVDKKFKLLEELIIVLKKRIEKLESGDQDLKNLVTNFSSLSLLLKDNQDLKKVRSGGKYRPKIEFKSRLWHINEKGGGKTPCPISFKKKKRKIRSFYCKRADLISTRF